MHTQMINYLKQYQEKVIEEDNKVEEEEIVRKRIDDALPTSLRSQSDWIPKRANRGYLTDKHTYSSMRKVSSTKSYKKFVFDSYTAKGIAEDSALNSKENLGGPTEQKPAASKEKDKEKDQKIKTSKMDADKGTDPRSKGEIKNYHIYRGANF